MKKIGQIMKDSIANTLPGRPSIRKQDVFLQDNFRQQVWNDMDARQKATLGIVVVVGLKKT